MNKASLSALVAKDIVKLIGIKGRSGNRGHAGRPGLRGGSAPTSHTPPTPSASSVYTRIEKIKTAKFGDWAQGETREIGGFKLTYMGKDIDWSQLEGYIRFARSPESLEVAVGPSLDQAERNDVFRMDTGDGEPGIVVVRRWVGTPVEIGTDYSGQLDWIADEDLGDNPTSKKLVALLDKTLRQFDKTKADKEVAKMMRRLDRFGGKAEVNKAISNYVFGGHAADFITLLKSDRVLRKWYRKNIDQLPFDNDGKVLLYRGGRKNGISWTLDKDAAINFAQYKYGGVGSDKSLLYGLRAAAAEKRAKEEGRELPPLEVYGHRFPKEAILLNLSQRSSEREVIIDPDWLREHEREVTQINVSR